RPPRPVGPPAPPRGRPRGRATPPPRAKACCPVPCVSLPSGSGPQLCAGARPGLPILGVLLRVLRLVQLDGAIHDVEGGRQRPAVLVRGCHDVLDADVLLTHLEVGLHAPTGQTHRRSSLPKGQDRSFCRRSAATCSVSMRLQNENRSLVRPSSGRE